MIGVKVKRNGEMYHMEFSSYSTMLRYLQQNRPSQFCFAHDGEETTGSKPIAATRVAEDEQD